MARLKSENAFSTVWRSCPDALRQFLGVISSRVFLCGDQALVSGIAIGDNFLGVLGGFPRKEHLPKPLQPAFRIAGDWKGKAVIAFRSAVSWGMTVIDAPTVSITVM